MGSKLSITIQCQDVRITAGSFCKTLEFHSFLNGQDSVDVKTVNSILAIMRKEQRETLQQYFKLVCTHSVMIEYSSELDNNTQKHKEKGIRYHQNNEIASEEKKKGKTRQIRNSHLGKKKKKT